MHDLQRRDTHLTATRSSEQPDLVCLSHLRWDFVYQRPQHLLSRCARDRRVFFCEEPIWLEGADAGQPPRLDVSRRDDGVYVVQPRLPGGLSFADSERMQQDLLDELFTTHAIRRYVCWYYSPMPLGFTRHLRPVATVYDCMDELSAFAGAPPLLREREQELFERADLVFTGGQSLYEAKRDQHHSVHAFPSSIDVAHFGRGRQVVPDAEGPQDQAGVGHPRLGYFGVIDERMDLELVAGVADARPDWHIVMIGPVVKIDPATLPQRANIHWLGGKDYKALPAYIAGWDVALMPFARNESTRFISPTKTPEYLAAGKPVVSTSIRDVVRPYGTQGLVSIADTVADFVAAGERELQRGRDAAERAKWLHEVDAFLTGNSWDSTWERMQRLIDGVTRSTQTSSSTTPATPRRPSCEHPRKVP
jgi:UDP-galactopyranose mutase